MVKDLPGETKCQGDVRVPSDPSLEFVRQVVWGNLKFCLVRWGKMMCLQVGGMHAGLQSSKEETNSIIGRCLSYCEGKEITFSIISGSSSLSRDIWTSPTFRITLRSPKNDSSQIKRDSCSFILQITKAFLTPALHHPFICLPHACLLVVRYERDL